MQETLPAESILDPNVPRKNDAKKSKKGSKPIQLSEEAKLAKDDVIRSLTEEKSHISAQKKKLRASRRPQPTAEAPVVPEELVKTSKKRKHRTEDIEVQDKESGKSKAVLAPEEPPKKKRKNRTEFTDPREDTTLNNQSRKALEYVFTQMNRPSKWKFNKARQNWLIRNIWLPESVSDIYFPLVLKYVANIQGGSRQKLIETCQTYLEVQEVGMTTEKEEVPSEAPQIVAKPSTTINPTPGPLIDIPEAPKSILKPSSTKPTPGPLIDVSDVPVQVPAPIPSSSAVLADIKRSRAEALLSALGSTETVET